jgi:HD-GYP domain-containing protein (c-di-GMP phosphodiesterase class II)
VNKQITKKSFFSIKKDTFHVGDTIDFDVYAKNTNKREKLFDSGHTITNDDIKTLFENEKIFIDSTGVDSYKRYFKTKKEKSKKTPKSEKTAYFSINKKAFKIGDTLDFSLYINNENKKTKHSERGHVFTKKDKTFFLSVEKVFIDDTDVEKYKSYIRLKKESLKSNEQTKTTDIEKIDYIAVNRNYFQIDDLLDFELFIDSDNEKNQFLKVGRIITKDDKKVFQETDEVYINSKDLDKYKAFVNLKKLAIELTKKAGDIDFTMYEIKRVLTDVFTKLCHIKNIQMVYPLVKNMANIIIDNQLKLKDLRKYISRDYTTATHSVNVSIYAAVIGMELKFSKGDMRDLLLSAILHDIGKNNIPDEILYKESKLNDYEYKEVRKHPTLGVLIAKEYGIIDKEILSGIHHHHERLDGSGYPNGSKNNNISLFARIIGICDTFDAMSTNRNFQDLKKAFDTLIEMKKSMNGKLDNELMGSFIKIISN